MVEGALVMNGENYLPWNERFGLNFKFHQIMTYNWTNDELAYQAVIQQQAMHDEADMRQEGWENEDG